MGPQSMIRPYSFFQVFLYLVYVLPYPINFFLEGSRTPCADIGYKILKLG